jgi:WhiB family redox-sensing transcriptional regulator
VSRKVPHNQDARRRPRPPIVDATRAACTSSPELFFNPDDERGPVKRERIAAAKAVCGLCPVWHDCQREAFRNREQFGTWGGLSADERNAAVKAHNEAREQARERVAS